MSGGLFSVMVPKINSWFPPLCCLCKSTFTASPFWGWKGPQAPPPTFLPVCPSFPLSLSWLLIVLPEGLRLVNVQRGSAYPPLFERLRQGLLVHQASPRGVDQERPLTHLRSTQTSRGGEARLDPPDSSVSLAGRVGLIKTSATMTQETRLLFGDSGRQHLGGK